ncbi:flagellar filament capping protein FliD [Nocardioides nitrophenolicus]|uniref:flagellar filament capping protein FliD n=1 Tax=Nocardioides nitrophenolicus TaxID=60489 RepID=UPI00195BAA1E|nr:flagellar filament capping protein FliD [Nocardioides nitrophenolicus]MBM7516391.1 flagellar hook-associated protein 2 [Nocardioides nitrophenolicus]
MATASIGGLASGLDTATIISQLMSLEAVPQGKLKTQLATEQTRLSSYQQLNARLATLGGTAGSLASTSTTTGTWSALKATSSNTAVSVTATNSAQPSAFTVTVGQTALSHQLAFTDAHAKGDVVTGSGTDVVLKRSGQADLTISTAGGTLEQVATAINAADKGVRATLVKVGSTGGTDQFRLLVESTATGDASAFELTAADGSALLGGTTVRAGRDASITIGGITATSATNTFTDVTPGVTITLGSNATGSSDIAVTRDAATRSAAVTSMVNDINGMLEAIATATAHNADATKAGVLSGDSTLRAVSSSLATAIYPEDGTSLATYGIQLDRYGKLTFDEAKFAAAYAADPDAVTAAITGKDGFAGRVQAVAVSASDKITGTVTNAVNGRTAAISRLNKSIEAWDDRLALRRTSLERQFTALETAMSQMQSQSNWLASQLSALTKSSE